MTDATTAPRAGSAIAHHAGACVMPALVVVRAAVAGRHLLEGAGNSPHGVLGEATYRLALVTRR